MILNVALNLVPTCCTSLVQIIHNSASSGDSHISNTRGLSLNLVWAEPCQVRSTATAGRRDKCFQFSRAQKETQFDLQVLLCSLKAVDGMHIPPVPAWENVLCTKTGSLVQFMSPWRQWHVTLSILKVGSVALVTLIILFLDRRSCSTLQWQQFL